MRVRGPWIIRGGLLDTALSSQSGTIPANNTVYLIMSPYTFFPGVLHKRLLAHVEMHVRPDFIFPPDADIPLLGLFNPPGGTADYDSEWRHVNP